MRYILGCVPVKGSLLSSNLFIPKEPFLGSICFQQKDPWDDDKSPKLYLNQWITINKMYLSVIESKGHIKIDAG